MLLPFLAHYKLNEEKKIEEIIWHSMNVLVFCCENIERKKWRCERGEHLSRDERKGKKKIYAWNELLEWVSFPYIKGVNVMDYALISILY